MVIAIIKGKKYSIKDTTLKILVLCIDEANSSVTNSKKCWGVSTSLYNFLLRSAWPLYFRIREKSNLTNLLGRRATASKTLPKSLVFSGPIKHFHSKNELIITFQILVRYFHLMIKPLMQYKIFFILTFRTCNKIWDDALPVLFTSCICLEFLKLGIYRFRFCTQYKYSVIPH